MSENLKVDISLGILNLSQKRGYKVYHMIARFFVYLTVEICVQNPTVLPFKLNLFGNLFIRILQKEFLEFFVEFIFIWPTVALLGVKDY